MRPPSPIETALAAARTGTVIDLAAGTYERDGGNRWQASTDGTKAQPTTLRGPRSAVLASDSITGDCGLSITGDYWRIEGLRVANATKGIVLDGSVGTLISGVEVGNVGNVGEEGIHLSQSVYDGYGTGNTFRGNRIEGVWPGFGIGLYPKLGNVAESSNTAPDALGLVGDADKPVSCN